MARQDRILESLMAALKQSEKKTSAYDTSATVRRIEGGIAWVHIPGGVDETPVKLTINAKAGDTVQVRVSGGRAFMVGNATAPPTDDRVATQAVESVKAVNKVVQTVRKIAESAARIAGNTNQYFWHVQEGNDTGAHITEVPQEDFLADPENGGGNLLARSNGIAVRNGLTELATFGANGSTVGKTSTAHMEQTPTKATWYGSDGTTEVLSLATGPAGNSLLHLSGNRVINATTSTMINDGVTTYDDNIDIEVYPISGHNHGKIDLTAWGQSGTGAASVRISDYEVYGTTVLICPSKVDIDTDVTIGKTGGDHISLSVSGSVKTSGNLNAGSMVNAGAVKPFTPTWSSGHTPVDYHCVVSAGVCSFSYRGPTIAHSANTQIGTLPVGARPTSTVYCPCVKMGGGAVGCMRIYTTGVVEVMMITDTASTGRLYFNCTFPVV
jgi:hypothetical protein